MFRQTAELHLRRSLSGCLQYPQTANRGVGPIHWMLQMRLPKSGPGGSEWNHLDIGGHQVPHRAVLHGQQHHKMPVSLCYYQPSSQRKISSVFVFHSFEKQLSEHYRYGWNITANCSSLPAFIKEQTDSAYLRKYLKIIISNYICSFIVVAI